MYNQIYWVEDELNKQDLTREQRDESYRHMISNFEATYNRTHREAADVILQHVPDDLRGGTEAEKATRNRDQAGWARFRQEKREKEAEQAERRRRQQELRNGRGSRMWEDVREEPEELPNHVFGWSLSTGASGGVPPP